MTMEMTKREHELADRLNAEIERGIKLSAHNQTLEEQGRKDDARIRDLKEKWDMLHDRNDQLVDEINKLKPHPDRSRYDFTSTEERIIRKLVSDYAAKMEKKRLWFPTISKVDESMEHQKAVNDLVKKLNRRLDDELLDLMYRRWVHGVPELKQKCKKEDENVQ